MCQTRPPQGCAEPRSLLFANKMITPKEAIEFHESREHGVIKSRSWPVVKRFVEKTGRFPHGIEFEWLPLTTKKGNQKEQQLESKGLSHSRADCKTLHCWKPFVVEILRNELLGPGCH